MAEHKWWVSVNAANFNDARKDVEANTDTLMYLPYVALSEDGEIEDFHTRFPEVDWMALDECLQDNEVSGAELWFAEIAPSENPGDPVNKSDLRPYLEVSGGVVLRMKAARTSRVMRYLATVV
ncbi:hypothetical protein OHS58_09995 [Amycolatopsis sp. NBC_00348]|uniref:hypothetical protein n=2 Tax=unclassified Amycolatopsis TaxID=2618356 RepID=UPI002E257060